VELGQVSSLFRHEIQFAISAIEAQGDPAMIPVPSRAKVRSGVANGIFQERPAMKTFMAKEHELEREWHIVDASTMSLGRLAANIAQVLMGKHKPTYTPMTDTGDFVVVINASNTVLTGKKAQHKVYRHHTQWVGGLKEVPYSTMLERHPERVIQLAVRRMLPKSIMGKKMLTKLKVYGGNEHPHDAQQPKPLTF
jgi:large subunit ribosomal protein L13